MLRVTSCFTYLKFFFFICVDPTLGRLNDLKIEHYNSHLFSRQQYKYFHNHPYMTQINIILKVEIKDYWQNEEVQNNPTQDRIIKFILRRSINILTYHVNIVISYNEPTKLPSSTINKVNKQFILSCLFFRDSPVVQSLDRCNWRYKQLFTCRVRESGRRYR